MMRNQFNEQLQALNLQMIQMGGLCETVISLAVQALQMEDKHLIQKVHETDGEIDQMERDIEAFCMRLLLHQQPVARDLRQISSALKMIWSALGIRPQILRKSPNICLACRLRGIILSGRWPGKP